MRYNLAAILISTFLLTGCSIQRFAIRQLDDVLDNSMAAVMEEPDLRVAEIAISSDLKLLDGLIKTDPKNQHLLYLASEGYASYALGFAEDSVDRAREFYGRSFDYGRRGMELLGVPDSVFTANPSTMTAALAKLSPEDLPVVFWTANGWGNKLNLERDNPESVAALPTVNAMMEWAKEKDSTYFNAGPLLYFGTVYGSLPSIFGGDTAKSRQYFESAINVTHGKFLMIYVYMARTYCVQTQNEQMFRSLLQTVIESKDEAPSQRLANAIARDRARKLLDHVSDFF